MDNIRTIASSNKSCRYRSRDFAFDGIAPDTIAKVLSLGHESPSYAVNWILLSYVARF